MKRLIMVVGVLMIFLVGCGGSGGGSAIKDIYEGTWIGVAVNIDDPSDTRDMRLELAYEGDDGFGNEIISGSWYVQGVLAFNGTGYGTLGGLLTLEWSDSTGELVALGNISGDTLTGSYSITIYSEGTTRIMNFTMYRQ